MPPAREHQATAIVALAVVAAFSIGGLAQLWLFGRSWDRAAMLWFAAGCATASLVALGSVIRADRMAWSARAEMERHQEKLRASMGQLMAFWEKAPLSIMLFEPHDPKIPVKIVDCNPMACAVHGYPREELIGQCVDLVEFQPWTQNAARWLQGLREHPHLEGEGKHKRKDGTVFDIEYYTSLIVVDGHELVVGMDHVATARKRIEGELAQERDLLRALLDNSPDQIYFKDTQSRFIRTSKSQAQNFGLKTADELLGKSDLDFFSEEHARPAFADEQEIIRTGRPMIGKVEKETWNDGRGETWVITSKLPLRNGANEIIGTFGTSKDITALKKTESELEKLHKQLLETSRQAGMAEVATGVLHNVGNVLNSVNVSATLVADQVRHSKSGNLTKVSELLNQHAGDLAAFLGSDPKGAMILPYLGTLAENLAAEQKAMVAELDNLRKNIEHIKDIVSMQQSYAKASGFIETVSVPDLVEDAIRINAGSLARHDVDTVREYLARPVVTIDKHKVMQILINLVRNAKYACDESGRTDKQITVRTTSDDRGVKIAIIDNGIGIPAENLTRIFNHGFTTRKAGHGFGLHSGALAAKEIGGALSVQSDGPGQGATFILELPYKPETITNEKPAR